MKHLAFFLCSAGFLVLGTAPASAGTTTLTTYYPAPNGNYAQLRLVPQSALPNPCTPGTMYVDSATGELKVCSAASTWSSISPWSVTPGVPDKIYTANLNSNVGIGVNNAAAKLEVVGNIIAATPIATDPANYVATKGYVDAAATGPGSWTCTVRVSGVTAPDYLPTATCSGNEKVISGGCGAGPGTSGGPGVFVFGGSGSSKLGSHPLFGGEQGWVCDQPVPWAQSAYANCCQ